MTTLYYASAWLYAFFAVQHVGLAIGHPEEREHSTMAYFGAGLLGYALASAAYYEAGNPAAAVAAQRLLAVTACIAGLSFLVFLTRLVPLAAPRFGIKTYSVLITVILFALSGAAHDPGGGPLWHGAVNCKSSLTLLGAVALSLAFGAIALAVGRSVRGLATQSDARTILFGGVVVLAGAFCDLLAAIGLTHLPPFGPLAGGVLLVCVGRVLTRRSSVAEQVLGRREQELHAAVETLQTTREFIATAASAASVGTAAAAVADRLRGPVSKLERAAQEVARDEGVHLELLEPIDDSINELNALVRSLVRNP